MIKNTALCFDLGGTKCIAAMVNSDGEILQYEKKLIPELKRPVDLTNFMIALGKNVSRGFEPISVAIASAGPLDPQGGNLLDPTNLSHGGEEWGIVDMITPFKEAFDLPVKLENDAAAAALSSHWLGEAKGLENSMTITLGTGIGVGAITNDRLCRAGRGLHPEVSHVSINCMDETAPCGCGNLGCVEAYLSGKNFCKRTSVKLGEDYISGPNVLQRADAKEPEILAAFDEYAELMAHALVAYVVAYAPEMVVFAGGFAVSHRFWLEKTRSRLPELLARRRKGIDMLPKLVIADESDFRVVQGAAYTAFH